MKVIQLKNGGKLCDIELVERPEPKPGKGEVLVRWRASSLNFHDYIVVTGGIPVADGRSPMSDGAGQIVAIGEGVEKWQVGDRVLSIFYPDWQEGRPTLANTMAITGETIDGCAVELACVASSALTRMPDGMSFAEAATLPCAALTAWRALMVEGNLRAGETVLIEGTGGMSIAALQLAKAAGAKVFATSSSEEKLERLKALGADEVVNYAKDPKWGKTIHRLSDGGVDHVLDVGGNATLSQSIEAVRMDGKVTLIGILGGLSAQLSLPKLFFKHLHLNGIAVGSREMQESMVAAYQTSEIRPIIDRTFALPELADAFRYQESSAHFGKIVLEF